MAKEGGSLLHVRLGTHTLVTVAALVLLTVGPISGTSYASEGQLDGSFDSDGKVSTEFRAFLDSARSIAIQSDGRLIAAGYSEGSSDVRNDFAVARYNTDGSLDTSFDSDGKLTTDFGSLEQAYAVDVQADGGIVVAGGSNTDFAVARYNIDGSLDTSFDSDGKLTTDFGGSDFAYAATIQSDGKIIAVGQ